MITSAEEDYIRRHAYLPEHLPDYVYAISMAEPYLRKEYIFYHGKGYITFIGYPLNGPPVEKDICETLDHAIERFRPQYVALTAPMSLMPCESCIKIASDKYYRIEIANLKIDQKLRNTIRRASRELAINRERRIKDEHHRLISEFINSHSVDDDTRYIFERIPDYLTSVPTAEIFSVRDRNGKLVAFDIAEFAPEDYTFYMFNFISQDYYVPGASDLILYEVIKVSKEKGKSFINLGLGINEGVTFFKRKWKGVPFLDYEFCLYQVKGAHKLKTLLIQPNLIN